VSAINKDCRAAFLTTRPQKIAEGKVAFRVGAWDRHFGASSNVGGNLKRDPGLAIPALLTGFVSACGWEKRSG
jgi:hypothetical protein